jgi:hypothetical protein
MVPLSGALSVPSERTKSVDAEDHVALGVG